MTMFAPSHRGSYPGLPGRPVASTHHCLIRGIASSLNLPRTLGVLSTPNSGSPGFFPSVKHFMKSVLVRGAEDTAGPKRGGRASTAPVPPTTQPLRHPLSYELSRNLYADELVSRIITCSSAANPLSSPPPTRLHLEIDLKQHKLCINCGGDSFFAHLKKALLSRHTPSTATDFHCPELMSRGTPCRLTVSMRNGCIELSGSDSARPYREQMDVTKGAGREPDGDGLLACRGDQRAEEEEKTTIEKPNDPGAATVNGEGFSSSVSVWDFTSALKSALDPNFPGSSQTTPLASVAHLDSDRTSGDVSTIVSGASVKSPLPAAAAPLEVSDGDCLTLQDVHVSFPTVGNGTCQPAAACAGVAVRGEFRLSRCSVLGLQAAAGPAAAGLGLPPRADVSTRGLIEVHGGGRLSADYSSVRTCNRPAVVVFGAAAAATLRVSTIVAEYDANAQETITFFMRVKRRRGADDGAAAVAALHVVSSARLALTGCRVSVVSPRYINAVTCALPYDEGDSPPDKRGPGRGRKGKSRRDRRMFAAEGCVLEYLHPDLDPKILAKNRGAGSTASATTTPSSPSSSSSSLPAAAATRTAPASARAAAVVVPSTYKHLAGQMHGSSANSLVYVYETNLPAPSSSPPPSPSPLPPPVDSGSSTTNSVLRVSGSSRQTNQETPSARSKLQHGSTSSRKGGGGGGANASSSGGGGGGGSPSPQLLFRGCIFLGNGLPHAVEQLSSCSSHFDECEFWDLSVADLHFDATSRSKIQYSSFACNSLKGAEGWDVQADSPRYGVYGTMAFNYNLHGGGVIEVGSCSITHAAAAAAGAGVVRTPEEVSVRISGSSSDFRHETQRRLY